MLTPYSSDGRMGQREPRMKQLRIRLWPLWWEGHSIPVQLSWLPWWGLVMLGLVAGIAVLGVMTIEPSSIPVIGAFLHR